MSLKDLQACSLASREPHHLDWPTVPPNPTHLRQDSSAFSLIEHFHTEEWVSEIVASSTMGSLVLIS